MIIKIAGKTYTVQEARTEEELFQGLKGVTNLPKDEGMLFFFDPPKTVAMTMKDTLINLDQVFINEDYEVMKVATRKAKDETLVDCDDVAYVLEVNANSGISKGDELEIDDSDEGPIMKVLFQDGSELYQLWGGERIFSRANTKVLIKKAKKAQESQDDKDFKALGKYMFKCIKILDERPAEYVDSPS